MKTLLKQGISGQNKEKQNYDKSTIHLPRQCLMQAVKALILFNVINLKAEDIYSEMD